MVMEVVHEDEVGDGGMHCANHPFKNTASPGGICAFCLQEKLGKLVSSSFPTTVFPSSSSSPSPSFRSNFEAGRSASSGAAAVAFRHLAPPSHTGAESNEICYYPRRSSRLPFVLTHRKKKTRNKNHNNGSSESSTIVFKRSKSTFTPRRGTHFLDQSFDSPNKRTFWSFLYFSKTSNATKSDKHFKDSSFTLRTAVGSSSMTAAPAQNRPRETRRRDDFVVVEENDESPDPVLGRKVSRSRSVGCGSRSFSGDFFERISTGFGDCTLRRVESQREGKPKLQNGDCIKEKVKCGGIFSGFMITSSSSSSSSLVSEENNNTNNNGKSVSVCSSLPHGRSKSWGWALASPMRAFSSKPSPSGKRDFAKQVTPNLTAIPSLLAAGG